MKSLIIYDLDGTLVDTREDIARAANHMLEQMGRRRMATEEVCRQVGRGLFALIQGCLETEDPEALSKGAKIYRDYYARHMLDSSRLYPGALEILDYFKDRKQAVITNKPNPFSYELLKALGVADYFFEIIPGNSGHPQKPDPGGILHLIKSRNTGPEETLFVGDSRVDIETGRNAGVETVVLTHGFGTLDELQSASTAGIFNSFHELLQAARKKGW
ncbi:MAG TPA: HAD-IA family hydrolase [bacterium]|nr:HAD-IA family hydrolase [bacterium]